jgi:hypothetical protein
MKAHYHGRLIHADGDIYEGEWVCGVAEGYGKYYKKGIEVYRGNFRNDLPENFNDYNNNK